jgi:hypothetical protein
MSYKPVNDIAYAHAINLLHALFPLADEDVREEIFVELYDAFEHAVEQARD